MNYNNVIVVKNTKELEMIMQKYELLVVYMKSKNMLPKIIIEQEQHIHYVN